MKSLKTPLRYPGGKSRACVKIGKFIPDLRDYKQYREPFLGGGSMAIHITKMYPRICIWVNDLYEPLVNFWIQLQESGQDLQDIIMDYKSSSLGNNPSAARQLFNNAKEWINDKDKDNLTRAAAFYIVNKCSFSGLTESSSFSPKASVSNFSVRGISKLNEYSKLIQNWHITNGSYENMLTNDKDTFTYLDPPYDIKDNLYGKKGDMHKRFDHDKFAEDCSNHKSKMIVSYNASQLIKDRFKDWNAAEFDLTYTMRSVGEYMREQQERKELLLFNYGTEGLAQFYQSDKETSD
jgi:DNA adenine methylase Dam